MLTRLHLRRLREQPLRTALAVLVVAAGVALTSGVLIARTSVQQSIDGYVSDLTGPARFRIEGVADHGGLDADVVGRVAAVPGVSAAVPLVVATTAADRGNDRVFVTAIGVDCAVANLLGGDPCAGAAVVGSALRGRVLRTDDGDVPLDDVPTADALDRFSDGRVAVFPMADAQRLFARPDRYDMVLVVPADGADDADDAALEAALATAAGPGAVVRDADASLIDPNIVGQLVIGLLLTSLVGLTIGTLLIGNVLALSFEERRREYAVVAAVGARPAVVARGIVLEAVALGAVGGVVGVVLGVFIARQPLLALSDQTERSVGIPLDVHVTALPIGVSIAAGIAAALIAAARPARQAARLDLAAELAERDRYEPAAHARPTTLVALGALAGLGLVVGWLGSRDGSLARWQPVAAVGGLLVASSCAFRLPARAAGPIIERLSRTGATGTGALRVAVGNLAADPRRVAAVSAALSSAIALGVTLGGLAPALERGSRDMARADAAGRVLVSPGPLNNAASFDARLSPAEREALAAVPGVAAIEDFYHATVTPAGGVPIQVAATTGPPSAIEVYRGDDPAAVLARGHALVGPAVARDHGLHPGDTYELPGRRGRVGVVVGAVWADVDGLGRNVTLPLPLFDRAVGPRPPWRHLLVPEQGVSTVELAARVDAAGIRGNMLVYDDRELAARFNDEIEEFTVPFVALQRALLFVAFAATLSTLLLAGIQRRREHALLAAVGMTPAGLARMTLVEVAVLGVLAIVLGTLAGFVGMVSFAWASGVLTGLQIDPVWSVGAALATGAVVAAVALVAAALPAWRTSRVEPALALRYE